LLLKDRRPPLVSVHTLALQAAEPEQMPHDAVLGAPQLSVPLTEPQFLPSRAQKGSSLSGEHATHAPVPLQVSEPEQVPQSGVRFTPQLSTVWKLPQERAASAHSAASETGEQLEQVPEVHAEGAEHAAQAAPEAPQALAPCEAKGMHASPLQQPFVQVAGLQGMARHAPSAQPLGQGVSS
jgi:hypothetical protein